MCCSAAHVEDMWYGLLQMLSRVILYEFGSEVDKYSTVDLSLIYFDVYSVLYVQLLLLELQELGLNYNLKL